MPTPQRCSHPCWGTCYITYIQVELREIVLHLLGGPHVINHMGKVHTPQRVENRYSNKYVYSVFTPTLFIIPVSINGWLDKQDTVWIHDEVLFSH